MFVLFYYIFCVYYGFMPLTWNMFCCYFPLEAFLLPFIFFFSCLFLHSSYTLLFKGEYRKRKYEFKKLKLEECRLLFLKSKCFFPYLREQQQQTAAATSTKVTAKTFLPNENFPPLSERKHLLMVQDNLQRCCVLPDPERWPREVEGCRRPHQQPTSLLLGVGLTPPPSPSLYPPSSAIVVLGCWWPGLYTLWIGQHWEMRGW